MCKQHTYRAPHFLMHSCCTVILSLVSRTDVTHHAWLKNHGAHCVSVFAPRTFTLHRAMSHVTPHLMTPSTGTPSSLILNPSFSEHKPCGDPRPHLSGALAEPRPLHHVYNRTKRQNSWCCHVLRRKEEATSNEGSPNVRVPEDHRSVSNMIQRTEETGDGRKAKKPDTVTSRKAH